jgi:hypothetical protein
MRSPFTAVKDNVFRFPPHNATRISPWRSSRCPSTPTESAETRCAQRRHRLRRPPQIAASTSHGRLRSGVHLLVARRGGISLCSTSAPRIVVWNYNFWNCILTHNHKTYCVLRYGKLGFIKVLGSYIFCEKLAKQLRNKST